MNHATLPESLTVQNTIAQMKPGQSGWTVPWGMWVDDGMFCWLHPEYTVHDIPEGTVDMYVTRTANGEYEVTVGAQHTKHRWKPESRPGYASSIPVARLYIRK